MATGSGNRRFSNKIIILYEDSVLLKYDAASMGDGTPTFRGKDLSILTLQCLERSGSD
jgi:hypothetical protein